MKTVFLCEELRGQGPSHPALARCQERCRGFRLPLSGTSHGAQRLCPQGSCALSNGKLGAADTGQPWATAKAPSAGTVSPPPRTLAGRGPCPRPGGEAAGRKAVGETVRLRYLLRRLEREAWGPQVPGLTMGRLLPAVSRTAERNRERPEGTSPRAARWCHRHLEASFPSRQRLSRFPCRLFSGRRWSQVQHQKRLAGTSV